MTVHEIAQQVGTSIGVFFTDFYTGLSTVAGEMATELELHMDTHVRVPPECSVALRRLSSGFLERTPLAVGAGAIFAVSRLSNTAEGVLEWWIRDSEGGIVRLDFDLTPGGERFYDYEQLPWFTISATTGHHAFAGPYVDYLGTDAYILTLTAPIHINGGFIGVAGSDIRVRDFENWLIPQVREIPGDAALLNGQDRVIVGNSGRFLAGDRVRETPAGMRMLPVDVPNLNLRLLYPESPSHLGR